MDPQQVEVEVSVVIPTDICLLLVRDFMHYAVCSNFIYHVHYILQVITGILITIFCALATGSNYVISIRFNFDSFLLTTHALR